MGKVFKITIKESFLELKTAQRKEKNPKKKLRIMSLILTKEEKFLRRVELAKFLGVNITTLNKWTDKYKESGLKEMSEIKSGGKRKETVPASIHKEIEAKLNNSTAPSLQGYKDGGLGLVEIGMFFMFLGVFIFTILRSLSKAPLEIKNHPMYDESVHLHI